MQSIILNNTNVVTGTNNSVFEYSFLQNYDLTDKEVALVSLSMYYSWFNVTTAYGNTTFGYTWVDGTAVSITLPDGYYNDETINAYMQYTMVQHGHYLIDDTGNYHYYINMAENSTYYSTQVNCLHVPSALAAGWSYPSGTSPAWVVNNTAPQFVVNDADFGTLIGFALGSFPSAVVVGSNYSSLSTTVPNITPVNSCLIQCSLCFNQYTATTGILHAFAPFADSFGGLVTSSPTEFVWVPIQAGSYRSFKVAFFDQNLRPMTILDPSVVISLAIRNKTKYN
jgi:hypothetical protein